MPTATVTFVQETFVHHVDTPRFIMLIHRDPSCGSTRIHHVYPPWSITWIHQDPSCGSTIIHHVDPQGSINCDPPGFLTWIHQDQSSESTRIHHVDLPGSIFWINHGVEGKARDQVIASWNFFLKFFDSAEKCLFKPVPQKIPYSVRILLNSRYSFPLKGIRGKE